MLEVFNRCFRQHMTAWASYCVSLADNPISFSKTYIFNSADAWQKQKYLMKKFKKLGRLR
nr:malate:quinone oxidoreductase [Metabacillus dongyingensis]